MRRTLMLTSARRPGTCYSASRLRACSGSLEGDVERIRSLTRPLAGHPPRQLYSPFIARLACWTLTCQLTSFRPCSPDACAVLRCGRGTRKREVAHQLAQPLRALYICTSLQKGACALP
ncbi:hypothetical protein BD626DRAFT_248096 [Schizophyllum amplum]|uniref:Uncharacterized protein n=1 Tax=Schizophyllum amplum TaxID=97359 RepID=A0A550BV65_9AGAR|nr:hypothetical protein BD626DRAFT_248096 [Auriculariopsis ampla]